MRQSSRNLGERSKVLVARHQGKLMIVCQSAVHYLGLVPRPLSPDVQDFARVQLEP